MQHEIVEKVQGVLAPWGSDTRKFVKSVRDYISCSSLAVGVINANDPQADELLAVHGWSGAVVGRWCSTAGKDKLLAAAMKDGFAVSYPGQRGADSALHKGGHAIVCVLPESIPEGRYWWLMLARDGNTAFSAADQQKAQLVLRGWQASFCVPGEQGMGRLIVGNDDRLIAADLSVRTLLLEQPQFYSELLTNLHLIVDQRFPKLADNETQDIAVKLGKNSYWVVFRKRRAVPGAKGHHWYIELRPLESDELTPVGPVKDERVATAIAYLHDRFAESPSLAMVSKYVHMSPFHFHRLFSKQVGVSPKHYLMRKQLQMAKWLLRAHRVPIGSIAAATGFSSHGHFTSTFHRLIGVSPTEYRESFY
ncbi:MAG: AraC family transcriptional regulator [Phycisphaeraceae bacterium]